MTQGGRMVERLMNRLDLKDEPLPLRPLIEIVDNRRVLIENHKGVTQYSTQQICVRLRKGSVCICGEGLHLAVMRKEQLVICGCIRSIFLNGGEIR